MSEVSVTIKDFCINLRVSPSTKPQQASALICTNSKFSTSPNDGTRSPEQTDKQTGSITRPAGRAWLLSFIPPHFLTGVQARNTRHLVGTIEHLDIYEQIVTSFLLTEPNQFFLSLVACTCFTSLSKICCVLTVKWKQCYVFFL